MACVSPSPRMGLSTYVVCKDGASNPVRRFIGEVPETLDQCAAGMVWPRFRPVDRPHDSGELTIFGAAGAEMIGDAETVATGLVQGRNTCHYHNRSDRCRPAANRWHTSNRCGAAITHGTVRWSLAVIRGRRDPCSLVTCSTNSPTARLVMERHVQFVRREIGFVDSPVDDAFIVKNARRSSRCRHRWRK